LYNEYDRAQRSREVRASDRFDEEHLPEAEAAMWRPLISATPVATICIGVDIVSRAWQSLQNDFVAEGKADG